MRYWLIVPAAGVGRRFGEQTPKQYFTMRGRTVLEWSLAPFIGDSRCAGTVVVLAEGDRHWPAIRGKLPGVETATGGAERCQSVRNGLTALASRAQAGDWVLVHDAARPCLPSEDLNRLLAQLERHPVGGLLAAPAADTLKASGTDQEVAGTVDRSGLWLALTPQMFRYGRLCEALDSARTAGRSPTDESQAMEWLGDHPRIVTGSPVNLKITSAQDLPVASVLLGARLSSDGSR